MSNTNNYPEKIYGVAIVKDEFAYDIPKNLHIGYIVEKNVSDVNGEEEIRIITDRIFGHDSCTWVYKKCYDILYENQ